MEIIDKKKYSHYYKYIKPLAQNTYVRSFAPHIFSLITIIFFTIFVIRPTVSTILELQKQIDDNKKVLNKLEEKAQNLSLGKQALTLMDKTTKTKISNAVPQKPDITFLIASLKEILGSSASISAIQIQPLTLLDNTKVSSGLNLGEVSFSTSIEGTYPQLMTVVYNLSKMSRAISVENLILSKRPEGTMVLSLSGKGYFIK